MNRHLAWVVLAACNSSLETPPNGVPIDAAGSTGSDGAPPSSGPTLAEQYPGDVGLGADPAIVWFEDFEAGSLGAITARYDQVQGTARMQLVTNAPKGSALALTAGGGVNAVDLYKQLPNRDEVYVRWYVNYDSGVPWHHAGMSFGGYNPPSPYPIGGAGSRPTGDDRFSISVEPVHGLGSAAQRFDFYTYWMHMHSWMATPTNDGTSYYGNTLVHRNDFTIDETEWVCLEVHLRLNPDPSSGAGAVLEVWKNDALVMRFDDAGPMGYWVRDKFCPAAADGAECTNYAQTPDQQLNLQYRSTTALAVNAFRPQNYITDSATGTLRLDQMVVATKRVGCLR